ncbi:MAG: hypothetical protein ABIN97_16030 [Ginsengibacter sp.]
MVYTEGKYFITFTCQDWLSLFEITNSYNAVYKWFDYLKTKGHLIKSYSPDSYSTGRRVFGINAYS